MGVSAERIAKIRAYAGSMASQYLAAHQKLAMIDALSKGDELAKAFDKRPPADGYNLLLLTLYLDVIKDLMAVTTDKYDTSPSLARVVDMISDSDTAAALRADYCKPLPTNWVSGEVDDALRQQIEAQINAEHSRTYGERFDAEYQRAIDGTKKLETDEVAARLKKARNKAIAHFTMANLGSEPRVMTVADLGVRWRDADNYAALVEPLIFGAVLIVTGAQYMLDEFKERHRNTVETFWRAVRNFPMAS